MIDVSESVIYAAIQYKEFIYIRIIKLTFGDKHESRSIQIIRMETTRSKQQRVVSLVFWWIVSEHIFIEKLWGSERVIVEFQPLRLTLRTKL